MNLLLSTVGLALSLLLATNCFAAGNTVDWRKFDYFSNQGGLNDQQSTTEIQDNEATDLQNIVFDLGGALKKRFGFTTIVKDPAVKSATGTTVSTTGLCFFKLDDNTKHLVAMVNNDTKATLMKRTYDVTTEILSSVGQWDNIDNAGLSSTYANTYQPDFAIARNVLVFTDGKTSNKPYKWTGTGKSEILSTDADLPNGSIIEYHKNHLFISGNDSYPSRIYFSEIDSITGYVATDFFDVETSDGTKVRSLLSAYDALWIFKDKSIWKLSGYERDSFRLEKMVDNVGTLSNLSPVATNTGIYFTSNQGEVFHYDGNYTCTNISRKISQTIAGIDKTKMYYTLGLAYSTYKFSDSDYYVAMTSEAQTTNDKVLVFDTGYKAWTRFKGITPLSWCVGDDDESGKAIYFGDYSGYVHRYPSTSYYDGNVSTSAIASYYQTKWFRYPEVCLGDKYWRLLKTYALSEDDTFLHAECKADYESSGKVVDINLESSQANWDVDLWDVALWGGSTIIVGRDEIEKGTNMFQIKYYNEDVNQGFTLLGFSNFVEPVGRV